MTDFTTERLEAESARLLQDLGLTEYEAYTFVYLLRLGSGTAKEVADLNHVPRTRVYDAVDSLHDAGLVDIQYTSPRRFTPVSRETALRKLEMQRNNTLSELRENFERLEPASVPTEEFGVWTVRGGDAVASHLFEYIDDATDEIVYMTVDELLTDRHIEHLQSAVDRGVRIYLPGISEAAYERIRDFIPEVERFETLWKWSEAGAGTLLITDQRTALVSVLVDDPSGNHEEVAIWGAGEQNSLVVVLRTIFTWRLHEETAGLDPD